MQTVTVTGASAAILNSTDATLGNNFDSRQILQLPSEGRNPVELLSLQPGVTYTGNNVDPTSDSRGGSVNGARSDQTNLTVDGLDNNDQLLGNAFTGVLRIPSESIEEFRGTTSSSNADTGRSSGTSWRSQQNPARIPFTGRPTNTTAQTSARPMTGLTSAPKFPMASRMSPAN